MSSLCKRKEEQVQAQKPLLYDQTPEQLANWLAERQQPSYRLKQILAWLPRGLETEEDLSDLPKSLRQELASSFDLSGLTLKDKIVSALDDTTRYVFELADQHRVETVFLPYKTGFSVCLSTQSGCKMACTFCASTGIGFGRNLTAGELYAQVARVARDKACRISHVVLMGIGEPLENYEEVVKFLHLVHDEKGLNISYRHITMSTCGLVPQMHRLAKEGLPITLALSLHAPNDALRQQLMPIARRYPLSEVIEAVKTFAKETGRRPTYEYALFRGVNDQPQQAEALAKLLKGQLCHVNLIPANEFPGGRYRRSLPEDSKRFSQILESRGIPCTIRRELGGDIAAACGQLRRKREQGS